MNPRVGAWAAGINTEALLVKLLTPWGGKLGIVASTTQARWAQPQRAFVIINQPPPGLNLPSDTLAILGSRDEPNWDGPSGKELDAKAVSADTLETRRAYPSIPVTNGALAFVGTNWQRAMSSAHFDKPYWNRLRGGMTGPWAFNAGDTRPALVRAALSLDSGSWLACGLVRRPAWRPDFTVLAWLVQQLVGMTVPKWVALAKRPDVLAVTFWTLCEATNPDGSPQTGYGIFKPRGQRFVLTTVGRALWRELIGNRRYPVVNAA